VELPVLACLVDMVDAIADRVRRLMCGGVWSLLRHGRGVKALLAPGLSCQYV